MRVDILGIYVTLGQTPVLQDVSCSVERGDLLAVVGPNGSGKSTLLRAITAALPLDAGQVLWNNVPPGIDGRRSLGVVTEEPALWPVLTVREQIELVASFHGASRPEIDHSLALLSLETIADQQCGTLSRGQRQRVALAQAIVHSPTLLVLDEPVATVDASTVQIMTAAIRSLSEQGATVVLTAHDSPFIDDLASRGVAMLEGRIVADVSATQSISATLASRIGDALSKQSS